MFEDIAKNLVVPKARGMTTVLIAAKPGQTDHRQDFDRAAAAAGTIDSASTTSRDFSRMVNETPGSQAGDPEEPAAARARPAPQFPGYPEEPCI